MSAVQAGLSPAHDERESSEEAPLSAKKLGKRKASPSPPRVSSSSPPVDKRRRRSSSAPARAPVLDVDLPDTHAGPSKTIDLTTDSDDEVQLSEGWDMRGGDEDETDSEDEMARLIDSAKERHVQAMGPAEVVDLTQEDGDEAEERNAPLASSSNGVVHEPGGPPHFSELTCPICMTPPSPMVATKCGHVFCGACLHAALYGQSTGQPGLPGYRAGSILHGKCPVCRTELVGGWGKAIRGCSFKVSRSVAKRAPPG